MLFRFDFSQRLLAQDVTKQSPAYNVVSHESHEVGKNGQHIYHHSPASLMKSWAADSSGGIVHVRQCIFAVRVCSVMNHITVTPYALPSAGSGEMPHVLLSFAVNVMILIIRRVSCSRMWDVGCDVILWSRLTGSA